MPHSRCSTCCALLEVGDWPFCPHGRPRYASHGIQTDESFIGGQWIENLGHEPVFIESRLQLKQEMEKRGLEQRIKYVPGDHYLTNWAAGMDAVTLENARVLVSRPGALKSSEPVNLRVQTFVRDPED